MAGSCENLSTSSRIAGRRVPDRAVNQGAMRSAADSRSLTVLDRLPLTASGKLDLAALPAPGGQAGAVRYRFTVEHPAQVTIAGL